jgi:hypothetical protein
MLGMLKASFMCRGRWLALAALCGMAWMPAVAQGDAGAGGGCVLKDHVYTCDGAAFQRALANAKTASIETHNVDGVARSQLTALITKKLGKTVAAEGGPADLVFLMIPIAQDGVVNMSSGDLGTLRIYSATADGAKGQLLWAETYTGDQDLPWPAVVNRLIGQFQARFHIK